MDWSQVKLISVIVIAIFTVIGGYALYNESKDTNKKNESYKNKATTDRKKINENVEDGKKSLSKVELALENLDYIGMEKVQELKEKYPYGYVIFGKLEDKVLTNGSSIHDDSLSFTSNWNKAELV